MNQDVPKWQRLAALAVLLLTVTVLVVFRGRLGADFWPPDASRIAPNILATIIQWTVLLLAGALLWPPTRRRIHGFVTGHLRPLHENHAQLLASHAELQKRLDHIIKHHPDIPALPRGPKERT